MTSLRKRVGAFALALSMCVSLVLGSVPAVQAASTAPTLYTKPKLVMDYLGDNKRRSDSSIAPLTGVNTSVTGDYVPNAVGDGIVVRAPAAVDQASVNNGADNKWNGFLSDADVGADLTQDATIFWMGIGIEDIDQFILTNEEKGIYSAEVGLYYNPYYAKPYVADGMTFADTMRDFNLSASPNKLNQWDSEVYQIIHASVDAENVNQLADPIDTVAVGDFTSPTQGYGTQEFAYGTGWKLAYVSVEIDAEKLAQARFNEASHTKTDTYYIAMFPFVLQNWSANTANGLCIRLARNASAFSIGGGLDKGMGDYGDNADSFGNWDKYTYHDPRHDLKLMFDYTGDLNIFNNTRDPDSHTATLVVRNDSKSPSNSAQLIINNEPFAPPPSQIAFGDGITDSGYNQIVNLSGGEELRVSAKKGEGYKVEVIVHPGNSSTTFVPTSIVAVDDWTDEWTFVMPNDTDVLVEVIFTPNITENTEFDATLTVYPASQATESVNTAQLTTPTGTTKVLGVGSDSMKVKYGTTVTVAVKRNSDYNVKVTVKDKDKGSEITAKLTNISTDQSSLNYTFTMPASGVTVDVEFELATPHIATLVLEDPSGSAGNQAQLSYTDGDGVKQKSDLVTGNDPKTGPHPTDSSLKGNQIKTRDQRTVTVTTARDPLYQVKEVLVYKGESQIPDASVPVSAVAGNPGVYHFTMPDYDVKVVVYYERVKIYKVRLVIEDAKGNEGATLTGTDTQPTSPHVVTLDVPTATALGDLLTSTANVMEVFSNAGMSLEVFDTGTADNQLSTARTAKVKVYYPEYNTVTAKQIPVSGSTGGGFSFNMRALDDPDKDEVVVVVTFEDFQGQRLTARIREYNVTQDQGASNAVWKALGHKKDIGVYENDVLPVKITVPAGYYISYIGVYDDNGTLNGLTEVGSPLGVPVTLTGIGYNNGQGGVEEAQFTMPGVNATLYIEYTRGKPDPEPEFTAAIRKYTTADTAEQLTLGDGTISITNVTSGQTDTYSAANGKWVKAGTGDFITATYTPDSNSFVAGVTVECDVPGTAVSWQFNASGGVEVTMPAANVVVTVKFLKKDPSIPNNTLRVAKDPANADGNVVATNASISGGPVTVTSTSLTTTAYEGELVTLGITVEQDFYIDYVELFDGATSVNVPYSGTGYNNGQGGTETAAFHMPALQNSATEAVVTVHFKDSKNDPFVNRVTLVVDEVPAGGNTADLILNSVNIGTADNSQNVSTPADAGDKVQVNISNLVSGYNIAMPVVTTPDGVVSPTWTGTGTFEFTMPNEPVTVTVPFRQVDPTLFYTTLIFRNGDGDSAAGVSGSIGTFGSYDDLDAGVLVYSRTGQAGEHIPYAVRIPDGYYISNVTVTPASFGVMPSITGMIGTQSGGFAMPAGNNILNIYISKGWPDQAEYQVRLHVTAPNDGVNDSTAILDNLSPTDLQVPVTVPGTPGQTSGVGMLTAFDGDKMRVTLDPAAGHTLKSLTLVDGNDNPVSYQWTTDNGKLAVEFSVPGSSVDVYVVYELPKVTPTANQVRLHIRPTGKTTDVLLKNIVSVTQAINDGDSFAANAGDNIELSVDSSTALIRVAYAIDSEGRLVNLAPSVATDPALAGSYVNEVAGKTYGFVMPFGTDVDVYLEFNETIPPPDAGEHTLTLMVNGPVDTVNNYNKVTVAEYDAATEVATGAAMAASAVGGNAMVVRTNNKITAEVVPASGCALYSLIAYTSTGERQVVSLDTADTLWNTYFFIMPDDTTHIEAEFRKVESEAYQIQVVVNNTVNGGKGNNDANLYFPVGDLNGFKFRDKVNAGDVFDLGLQVESGYQVDSIIAVPQGSGVAANIPIPATYDQRAQVKMPASNLVIYVTFKMDVTTRFKVTGTISYLGTVTPPASPDRNTVTVTGKGSNEIATAQSNSDTSYDGVINEANGQRVEAVWSCAPGYSVSSYTVTEDASKKVVLSEPMYNDDGVCVGLFIMMPAASVTIDVKFTDAGTPREEYKATLHVIDPDGSDSASITAKTPAVTVSTSSAASSPSITGLHMGDKVSILGDPDANRYVQTIYVLQKSPMGGQMITFPDITGLHYDQMGTDSTTYFAMPPSDVDVYVVFTNQQPDPQKDFTATVEVNGGGTTPDPNNYAVLSGTFNSNPVSTPHANCDDVPQSILVNRDTTVTLTVTVDNFHEIDSVIYTPIGLQLTPDTTTTVGNVTTYTFTMPGSNVGVIVNLKEAEADKFDLRLHVINQLSTKEKPLQMESDNETILTYNASDPQKTLVQQGAIPNVNDSVVPVLKTPAGETVTLTTKPMTTNGGDTYFVRAAYVVYNNKLVELKPTDLPGDYAGKRLATGLEGLETAEVPAAQTSGVSGTYGTDINTATFEMQPGYTDVYVVYERGVAPTDPWYNVVVIATDTGGAKANSGLNKVAGNVPADSVPSALRSTVASSDGSGVYSFSVSPSDTVRIDATDNHKDYRYDDATGMIPSYQVPGMAVMLNNADAANHPLGEIQEFDMPSVAGPIGNVGIHVNFVATGATGLTATLHVVRTDPDKVPGYSDNTVVLSVGSVGGSDYRFVNNQYLGQADEKNVLTDLVETQTITTRITQKAPGTRVVRVVVSIKDDHGVLGTVPANNTGHDVYTYVMTDKSVDVYVVLAPDDDTDRFVATAAPVYGDGVSSTNGLNRITAVTNTTDPTMNSSPYWTEIRAGHQVRVDFVAEPGVYVEVVAVRADDPKVEVKLEQFGVGDGTAGYAYVQTPTPGCNVTIEVRFTTEAPKPKKLTFESEGHAGLKDNVAKLDVDRDGTFESTLTPTSGVTTKLSETLTDPVTPGTALGVEAEIASGYSVEKVYVISNDVTVVFYLEEDNNGKPVLKDAAGNQVDLRMPTADTTIIVYFVEDDDSLRPYDPDNVHPDAVKDPDKKYEEHWIRADNRGDYLIVTIDMLNKKDGLTPTSVRWEEKVHEDTFKFYLQDDTDTTKYYDLASIIELTRPDDAPDATTGDPTEYWLQKAKYHYATDGKDYDSAKFILTVKDDADLKTNDEKKLAAILRGILDNNGTKKDNDKYSLYITCVQTTYQSDKTTVDTTKESEKVDFQVAPYYSLNGVLESYAPRHTATFTLRADTTAADAPVFITTLTGDRGSNMWQQDFKMKLTSEWELIDSAKYTFTLTIEKASHVTYTRTNIVLDKTLTGCYNENKLAFSFQDTDDLPIRLICGDLDGNGAVKVQDVDMLSLVLYGPFGWTTETDPKETGWIDSVHNPNSWSYLADLNGDFKVTVQDLDIMFEEFNYNLSAEDYGTPEGLSAPAPQFMYLALGLPQWAMDMMAAGKTIPEWAMERLLMREDLPQWTVSYIQSETEIPSWALAKLEAGEDVPAWAVEFLTTNTAVPGWALTKLENSEDVPAWAVELLTTNTAVPDWALTKLENNEDVPAWTVEFLTANVDISEWAVRRLEANEDVPGWAVELIREGEALPEWLEEILNADEPIPETMPEAPALKLTEKPLDQELLATSGLAEGQMSATAGAELTNGDQLSTTDKVTTDVTASPDQLVTDDKLEEGSTAASNEDVGTTNETKMPETVAGEETTNTVTSEPGDKEEPTSEEKSEEQTVIPSDSDTVPDTAEGGTDESISDTVPDTETENGEPSDAEPDSNTEPGEVDGVTADDAASSQLEQGGEDLDPEGLVVIESATELEARGDTPPEAT